MQARRHNCRVIHISPDINNEKNTKPIASKSKRRSNKKASKSGCCSCHHLLRNARQSAKKLFRVVRAKMSRAIWAVSKKGSTNSSACSGQQKFAPARDSHQSEDVEDCIVFMNSSSRKSD